MTEEKKNLVLWSLANGHPCNTSSDYSVSIYRHSWGNNVDYEFNVFPADGFPWFIDMAIEHLLAISNAFYVRLSIDSRHGVPVAHFR